MSAATAGFGGGALPERSASISLPAFELPPELEADAPPRRRDRVRLLVATPTGIAHSRFDRLGAALTPGDLLVVNTSATLAAALDGRRPDGREVVVHVAAELDDGRWVVEVRPSGRTAGPVGDLAAGECLALPGSASLPILDAHPPGQHRLWRAAADGTGGTGGGADGGGGDGSGGMAAYLARYGRPIRYAYVPDVHPLADYQTVFARTPGSAEMPSAARPFTDAVVTDLVVRGVLLAPITLHTGVSSPDAGEPPQPERFVVPESTARLVNATRAWGGRVVAVGTTAVRALESAVDASGTVRAARGWTDLVPGPRRPARVVDGLVTGWHAPGASHLALLQAVAGAGIVERAYAAALRHRYRWHEFGDSCLLLP